MKSGQNLLESSSVQVTQATILTPRHARGVLKWNQTIISRSLWIHFKVKSNSMHWKCLMVSFITLFFFFLTYQWPLHSIIKIPSRCFCYTRTFIYSWVKLYLPQTENELFLHLCGLKSLYNMNILLLIFQLLSN